MGFSKRTCSPDISAIGFFLGAPASGTVSLPMVRQPCFVISHYLPRIAEVPFLDIRAQNRGPRHSVEDSRAYRAMLQGLSLFDPYKDLRTTWDLSRHSEDYHQTSGISPYWRPGDCLHGPLIQHTTVEKTIVRSCPNEHSRIRI